MKPLFFLGLSFILMACSNKPLRTIDRISGDSDQPSEVSQNEEAPPKEDTEATPAPKSPKNKNDYLSFKVDGTEFFYMEPLSPKVETLKSLIEMISRRTFKPSISSQDDPGATSLANKLMRNQSALEFFQNRVRLFLDEGNGENIRKSVRAENYALDASLNFGLLLLRGDTEKLRDVQDTVFTPLHINPETERIGIVRLYKSFFDLNDHTQAGILIHEARHSDCTDGATLSTSEKLEGDSGYELLGKCFYPHVSCPKDHELSGLFACDPQAWGAYSFSAIYFKGISENCKECTHYERVMAEAEYLDSKSRIQSEVWTDMKTESSFPDLTHKRLRVTNEMGRR